MTDSLPAADPMSFDATRAEVAGATGAARGGVDVAQSSTAHTARQIVYAIAQGAAEHPGLRELLRELATESERLSGNAVRVHSRYLEAERAASAAIDSQDRNALVEVRGTLEAVHADGIELHAAAVSLRRRLPRVYGDPLEIDPDWPTSPDEPDEETEASDAHRSVSDHLRGTVAASLDVDEPRRRAAALGELLEFIEEAQGPATLMGGFNTLLDYAYAVGFDAGRYGGQTRPTPPVRVPPRERDDGVSLDGDAWLADYLRTRILAALEVEDAAPTRARQIAELVAETPVDTTAQGALITTLASAHEVGRRHGVSGDPAGPARDRPTS